MSQGESLAQANCSRIRFASTLWNSSRRHRRCSPAPSNHAVALVEPNSTSPTLKGVLSVPPGRGLTVL